MAREQLPRMVVKVEFHQANGVVRSFGEFDMYSLRSSEYPFNENRSDVLAEFGDTEVVVRDMPRWLPIWHWVKEILNTAFPFEPGFVLPDGWSESERAYEIYCPHGVGHYTTGPNLTHGCEGCCGPKNLPNLYPQANYVTPKEVE